MKNKIIKILCGIICCITIILIMGSVNEASSTNQEVFSDIVTNYASDTSGEASSINRIAIHVITILKVCFLISGIVFLINGIRNLKMKKVKKGIIYIIFALLFIWAFIMLDAIAIHDHNIEV